MLTFLLLQLILIHIMIDRNPAMVLRRRESDTDEATAFDLLFSRRRRSLYALALQRLKNTNDAEDAVQETYVKARSKVAWESVQSPDAMLTTIHLNAVRDILRRRKQSPVDTGGFEEAAESIPSPHANPEQVLLAKLSWKRLAHAIEALPPVSRKVFIMGKIEQLSHAEISASTGMSRAAIEKNLVRAMQRLRRSLG